jgi:hypothetical protein
VPLELERQGAASDAKKFAADIRIYLHNRSLVVPVATRSYSVVPRGHRRDRFKPALSCANVCVSARSTHPIAGGCDADRTATMNTGQHRSRVSSGPML